MGTCFDTLPRRFRPSKLRLGLIALTFACGGSPVGPATGEIHVVVTILGDPSERGPGLTVRLDDGEKEAISGTEAVFENATQGEHEVKLETFPLNCSLSGSSIQTVTVEPENTTLARFDLECSLDGTLTVITRTREGMFRLNSYMLILDDQSGPAIGINGRASLELPPGFHDVGVGGVPSTCAVDPANPQRLVIASGDTSEVTFEIDCLPEPLVPSVTVTVSTGSFFGYTDTDGYYVVLDGASAGHVRSNGWTALSDVTPGQHSVGLTGLAEGCSYPGPAAIVVPDSGSADARFLVSCFIPGVP
jgi:hypothetical protein